jgi:hypothetical protein
VCVDRSIYVLRDACVCRQEHLCIEGCLDVTCDDDNDNNKKNIYVLRDASTSRVMMIMIIIIRRIMIIKPTMPICLRAAYVYQSCLPLMDACVYACLSCMHACMPASHGCMRVCLPLMDACVYACLSWIHACIAGCTMREVLGSMCMLTCMCVYRYKNACAYVCTYVCIPCVGGYRVLRRRACGCFQYTSKTMRAIQMTIVSLQC